mmetsp:Transcript_95357/g.199488  ORF Transcript_95357/g.199488 Transcript_95357/m.199488 type:complete len:464 (+) Transcript_95357:145-1536(+)|eukprot:CAMPEP_0206452136 /NCGR_PEP_ID=MMETSP0324_2-20121206/19767_1 /ASSEMBLY_ACC=CAM_ASM_000836 /TAXON_ID=2866 /ORGANISM="Crypthecodinium cohnii, Strain Seligo" /LENGTH=463 /DNA_ID=CAMNT_0053922171 /DNA_START=138 /DNA_END=1529 /DNA_ORIENTATION=+
MPSQSAGCRNQCFPPAEEDDEDMEAMSFMGENKGDHERELTYRYVGEGAGDYRPAPPPRPACCSRCGFCACLVFLCGLLLLGLTLSGQLKLPEGSEDFSGASCDPRVIEIGDQVQAAFDLAFKPSGYVTRGSVGTVTDVLPDEDKLKIDWEDYSALKGTKVKQVEVYRKVNEGDKVQTLREHHVARPTENSDEVHLNDVVLAQNDVVNGPPKGSIGYVTSVGNDPSSVTVDFPLIPMTGIPVVRSNLVKAPVAGDHVKALSAITADGFGTVVAGTPGVVLSTEKSGTTEVYKIAFEGFPQAEIPVPANAMNLEPSKPDSFVLRSGVTGTVNRVKAAKGGLEEALLEVSFPDHADVLVQLSRSEVVKFPDWSKALREHCCSSHQVACDNQYYFDVTFTCAASPQAWSTSEKTWCCRNRNIGCEEGKDGSDDVFDCDTSKTWSDTERAWCCKYRSKGCTSVQPSL